MGGVKIKVVLICIIIVAYIHHNSYNQNISTIQPAEMMEFSGKEHTGNVRLTNLTRLTRRTRCIWLVRLTGLTRVIRLVRRIRVVRLTRCTRRVKKTSLVRLTRLVRLVRFVSRVWLTRRVQMDQPDAGVPDGSTG